MVDAIVTFLAAGVLVGTFVYAFFGSYLHELLTYKEDDQDE